MSSKKESREPRKEKKMRKQGSDIIAETEVLTKNTQKGGNTSKIKWPPFIIKSGYNGGNSIRMTPMDIFTTLRNFERDSIIIAEFLVGEVKPGDRIRFVHEETNFTMVAFVGSIQVRKIIVPYASASTHKHIAISLVNKDGKRIRFRELSHFCNCINEGKFR